MIFYQITLYVKEIVLISELITAWNFNCSLIRREAHVIRMRRSIAFDLPTDCDLGLGHAKLLKYTDYRSKNSG